MTFSNRPNQTCSLQHDHCQLYKLISFHMSLPPAESKASPRWSKGGGSSRRHRLVLILLALALLAATMLQYGYLMATDVTLTTAKQRDIIPSDFLPLVTSVDRAPGDVAFKSTSRVAESATGTRKHSRGPNYHVIFSTSCVPLQHWQSYLFFYSAMKVGQPGNVVC
jgi:hypothetical protein